MAGKILTVEERGITALQYLLRTIKYDNGYSTDVNRVLRKDGNHIAADMPPEIVIYGTRFFPEPLTGQATQDRVNMRKGLEIRLFALAPGGLDRYANLMVGDVKRCVPNERIGSLTDPFYPNGDFRFTFGGGATFYSVAERGQIMVKLFLTMFWHEKATDPRLWDDEDMFVREEQMPLND